MREIVLAPDFLDNNYLSTDARIPVTLLRTNACSPLATNAIRGNIWDNFSSSTYKALPYTDPDYYNDPKLVRPYRVGMSCGMCHVGPSPIHPPADPAHPEWANLNSTVGAQYLWWNRLFAYRADLKDFVHQLTNTYAPGISFRIPFFRRRIYRRDCGGKPRR
jgi:hypothetical protein